ncbi:MAG: hypothetical protein Aurels2KO_04740 [Aureliella sp.]
MKVFAEMKFSLNTAAALLCIASVGFVGCAPETAQNIETESHGDEHVHPESFADALAVLSEQQKSISEAFMAGDPDAAHEPLHEVGHTLELLPDLAKEAGANEEAQTAISAAVEELFTAFGSLDEVLHGGEEISYDDVKDQISTAMESLSGVSVPDGEHAEGHGDGHEEEGTDHS